MSLRRQVLRSMNRKPGAKRRFNLLREELAVRPGRQRGLSVLGPFVLFAGLPLAGIWQIQSDLDPLLRKTQITGQGTDLDESGRALEPPTGERGALENPPRRKHRKSPRAARLTQHVQTKEQAFYRKAQSHHKRRDHETAVTLYRQVLQENPGHRDALFHLSSIYLEQAAYSEAYPLVRELVRLEPNNARALVNLGVADIALGRPEKAIAHLDKALTLQDPPRFEIYYHQGVARSKLQRLEEAITWYRQSEDLEPGHAHLLFNMAVTFDRLERYNEALDCYRRFLNAGGSASPRERREVEARIGVLMAYLAREPEPPTRRGAH